MTIFPLSTSSFEDIIACFLTSFEGYFVPMPTDKEYYRNRWNAAGVDFELSYGMYDNDKLVGFIIHAIDTRSGVRIAYNTGTGVIPEFRGQKIVKSIYDHASFQLRRKGMEMCTLEVITKNELAIKAYESVGFQKVRVLKCYSGEIKMNNAAQIHLIEKPLNKIPWDQLPNQDLYSWDFQKETLIKSDNQYFEIWNNNELESFFIINQERKIVSQMDVISGENGAWSRLFSCIRKIESNIRIINVDNQLREKINQIVRHGLQNTIDQYEMKMVL